MTDSATTQQRQPRHRPLFAIAAEVREHWARVNYTAEPYLAAMGALTDVSDNFGYDSGASIVRYFLANASTFRGTHARRIKHELKRIVNIGEGRG